MIRKSTIVATAFSLAACATTESPDASDSNATAPAHKFEFTDCELYAKHVAHQLDEESRSLVKKTEYDDLVQFHHGWGPGIRNASGLWAGNDELNRSCARLRGRDETIHPDGVSLIVIEEVWKLLREANDT